MYDNHLFLYLKELKNFETRTREEEKELFIRYRNGDESAYEDIIKANLRFVVTVAKQYQNEGVSLIDLIEEGNYGLMLAIKKFDIEKKIKFISYAVWWIRYAILEYIKHHAKPIRIPNVVKNNMDKCKKINDKYIKLEDLAPEHETISKETGLSVKEVKKYLDINHSYLNVNDVTSNGKHTYLEVIKNKDNDLEQELYNNELQYQLIKCLKRLPYREYLILRLYYGIGVGHASTKEISKMLNMSSERIRQLCNKGIEKLKKLNLNYLKEWL